MQYTELGMAAWVSFNLILHLKIGLWLLNKPPDSKTGSHSTPVSHASDSDSLPGHPESLGRPPLHALVLDLDPDPQVTEHDDHSPKSAQAEIYIKHYSKASSITYWSGIRVCHKPKLNLFPKLRREFCHRMCLRLLIRILLVG